MNNETRTTLSFTIDTTPPSAIINLTAQAGTYPLISLNWNLPPEEDISRFVLYRYSETITDENKTLATRLSENIPATATSYTDTTGKMGVTYYYALTSIDLVGNESGLSNPSAATVLYPQPKITAIEPISGVNTGGVAVVITGEHFYKGVNVKLFKSPTYQIIADNIVVVPATKISCIFDLMNKETGLYELIVLSPDQKTQTSYCCFNVQAEAIPPTITNLTPLPNAFTNQQYTTISAEVRDFESGINAESIKLKLNNFIAIHTYDGTTVSYSTILNEGQQQVYLEVKDNVGNLASKNWTFTIDTTLPQISTITRNIQNPTTGDNVVFTINATDNFALDKLQLIIDGAVAKTYDTSATSISTTYSQIFSAGIHTYYAVANDKAGNTIATAQQTFEVTIYDKSPPLISELVVSESVTIDNKKYTKNNLITITATITDVETGINKNSIELLVDSYKFDVTVEEISTNSVKITASSPTTLSDDKYTAILTVKNNAELSNSAPISFIIDTTPPYISEVVISELVKVEEKYYTKNNQPEIIIIIRDNFSGVVKETIDIEPSGFSTTQPQIVQLEDGSWRITTKPATILQDGEYSITIRNVADKIGNVLSAQTISFIIDATLPQIVSITPVGTIHTLIPRIAATITDAHININELELKLNNISLFINYTPIENGYEVYYIPAEELTPDLEYTVELLNVADFATNTISTSYSFIIKEPIIPPTITQVEPSQAIAGKKTLTSVTIKGNNFQEGLTVSLLKSHVAQIDAKIVSVSTTQIECQVDLSTAPTGSYNLIITNPDGGLTHTNFNVIAPEIFTINLKNITRNTIENIRINEKYKVEVKAEQNLASLQCVIFNSENRNDTGVLRYLSLTESTTNLGHYSSEIVEITSIGDITDAVGRVANSLIAAAVVPQITSYKFSNELLVDLPPQKPTNFKIVVNQDENVTLTWSQPELDIKEYYLYKYDTKIVIPATMLSYQDEKLTESEQRKYKLIAVDEVGQVSEPIEAIVIPARIQLTEYGTKVDNKNYLTRNYLDFVDVTITNQSPNNYNFGPIEFNLIDADDNIYYTQTYERFTLGASATQPIRRIYSINKNLTDISKLKVNLKLPATQEVQIEAHAIFQLNVRDSPIPYFELFTSELMKGAKANATGGFTNYGSVEIDLPFNTVSVKVKDTQGNILAQGYLTQQDAFVTIASNEYKTLPPITIPPLPINSPDTVIVEATLTPYYKYGFENIKGEQFITTIITTTIPPPYIVSAAVDKEPPLYDQGEQVIITGQALSTQTNQPAGDVPVKIIIKIREFKQESYVTTDTNGNYTYIFKPVPTPEAAGLYTVSAAHPLVVTPTEADDTFEIIGLQLTPETYDVRMSQNSTIPLNFTITNTGVTKLTWINVSINPYSQQGVTATVDTSTTSTILNGGEQTQFNIILSASPSATLTQPDIPLLFKISVNKTEGVIPREASINVRIYGGEPILSIDKTYIEVGFTQSSVRQETVTLTNIGFATLKDVKIILPEEAFPWIKISRATHIGNIEPNQLVKFDLIFEPTQVVPCDIYEGEIIIESSNYDKRKIYFSVTVASEEVGGLHFIVKDTASGEPIKDAKITITHQKIYQTFHKNTNEIGEAIFENISTGEYQYRVEKSGYMHKTKSVLVEAGIMKDVTVDLVPSAVTAEWSVTPVMIEDKYVITLEMTYETLVPVPALMVHPTYLEYNMAPGTSISGQIEIENLSTFVSAFDVKIEVEEDPASYLQLQYSITHIPELKAGEKRIVLFVLTLLAHHSPQPVICEIQNKKVRIGHKWYCTREGKLEGGGVTNVNYAVNVIKKDGVEKGRVDVKKRILDCDGNPLPNSDLCPGGPKIITRIDEEICCPYDEGCVEEIIIRCPREREVRRRTTESSDGDERGRRRREGVGRESECEW